MLEKDERTTFREAEESSFGTQYSEEAAQKLMDEEVMTGDDLRQLIEGGKKKAGLQTAQKNFSMVKPDFIYATLDSRHFSWRRRL